MKVFLRQKWLPNAEMTPMGTGKHAKNANFAPISILPDQAGSIRKNKQKTYFQAKWGQVARGRFNAKTPPLVARPNSTD